MTEEEKYRKEIKGYNDHMGQLGHISVEFFFLLLNNKYIFNN